MSPTISTAVKQVALAVFIAMTSLNVSRAETYVYVSESNDRKIAIYSLNEQDGSLTRIGEIQLDGTPGCLSISPDKRRMYASVRSSSEFATLSVDARTGLLSKMSSAPSAGSAAYVYTDKTGNWLLAAYYGEGCVSVSRIVNGEVQGKPAQVIQTGQKAHCIQTDPSNRFAFTPHTGSLNKVQQFTFDAASGSLALNSPPQLDGATGAGPRHMQFHPNGKWVYLVNEQSKSVTHCDYDSKTGTLSRRQTLSTHPQDWDLSTGSCADIEITSDGRFVYASNRGHDSLAAFRIDSNSGELTSLGRTKTEKTPRSFNLIPGSETFVVTAGQGSNRLIVYRRDVRTGALDPLKTYDCGKSPAWVLGVEFP